MTAVRELFLWKTRVLPRLVYKAVYKVLTSKAAFEWQGFYRELKRVLPHVRKWVEGPPDKVGFVEVRTESGCCAAICVVVASDASIHSRLKP